MEIKIKGYDQKIAETMEEKISLYRKGLKLEMWRALSLIEAAMVMEITRKFNQRTGTLRNSIYTSVKESGDEIVGIIGNSAVYAMIHERGGIIKPKRMNYLKFPTENNQKADGSPIESSGSFPAALLPLKKGDGYLIISKADQMPKFLLKKEVTIPARPFAGPAFKKTRKRVMEKFGLFLSASFEVRK